MLRKDSFSLDRFNDEASCIVFNDHELTYILALVDRPQLIELAQHLFQSIELDGQQVLVLKDLTFEVSLEEVRDELLQFAKVSE